MLIHQRNDRGTYPNPSPESPDANPTSQRQHANLNQILNKEVEHCSGRAGPHPLLQPHTFYPISYKHTYTTDTFFPASQAAQEMGFPHAKRRVTRDDKTGRVVECLEKTKVGDLNIFSPNEEFDWRVSVNMEVPGTFAGFVITRFSC